MPHLEPEQLALVAMGEPVASSAESDHLAACPECSDELALLRHTAIVGRSAIDAGEFETPDEIVWIRIADELQLTPTPVDARAEASSDEETGPVPRVRAAARRDRPRRRSRALWVLAASLVVVAGMGVGGMALVRGAQPVEVAAAALDAFPDHPGAAGAAVVEEGRDGELRIRVTVDAATAPDTYQQVWLITGDATALISLGVLTGTEGTFPVPDGVDIRDYVLVDVSQEPIDGDPAHSGDSIVRGELDFL